MSFGAGMQYTGVQSVSPAPGTLVSADDGLNADPVGNVRLGQLPGTVGDPAQLLTDRQIPMPAGRRLRLTGFDIDPVGETDIAPSLITLTGDQTFVNPLMTIIETAGGTQSQLGSDFLIMLGNALVGAPVFLNFFDISVAIFPWTLICDATLLAWIQTWGDTSGKFSEIRYLDGGTMQIALGGVAAAAEPSAVLQLVSNQSGFLPPKLTTVLKNNIVAPARGLLVYDTTLNKLSLFTGAVWETVTSV